MKSVAIVLHVLSVTIWVGGMFFAYMAQRPAAASVLEPPQRLTLWVHTFRRFFPWVWVAIILIPVTGYWMIFNIYGGFATTPRYIHIMNGIGTVMILIYLHVFFAPFRRLSRAVAQADWPAGGKQLNQIRRLVGVNTILGLTTILVAAGGRYFG